MSYTVEYLDCRICGADDYKFLGIRGNMEYTGSGKIQGSEGHMVTNVVKCKKCGFVYTNPLIKTELKGYNDPSAYLSSSSVEPEILFTETLKLIDRYSKKGRLLDVGCGKGEFLKVAKNRGWDSYGLEPSKNFARVSAEKCGLEIRPVLLKDAKYPDSFFDVVTLNMVLEHVDNPRDILSEIRRILKKGGLLFIEVPNMDSLMLKAATLYLKLMGKEWSPLLSPLHYPFHAYGYNAMSLRRLLQTEGFKIRKISVTGSDLRGFRSDSGGTRFEKLARGIVAKIAGMAGRGDILLAIGERGT